MAHEIRTPTRKNKTHRLISKKQIEYRSLTICQRETQQALKKRVSSASKAVNTI